MMARERGRIPRLPSLGRSGPRRWPRREGTPVEIIGEVA